MTSNASYNKDTTSTQVAQDFADQVRGRNILITGVSPNGIGAAAVEALVAQSPNLITVSGRSISKLNESIAAVKEKFPNANIRPLVVDLSSLESVRNAAAEFNATPENLDILINNAGVMSIETRTLSVDGIEMQFATNHIGHFYLTNLIMPKLLAAAKNSPKGAVRIINVSSVGHQTHPIRFSDYNWEGGEVPAEEQGDPARLKFFNEKDTSFTKYTPLSAYGQSKTANVLFSVGLTQKLYEKYGILSLALNAMWSNLGRHMSEDDKAFWESMVDQIPWKTLDQGSSTSLVAALDPKLNSWEKGVGYYLVDCQFEAAKEWAVNEEFAQRLWELSEKIVRQKFEF